LSTRPGRPSPEREIRIKDVILNLIPSERPGIRFKQIAEAGRVQGISKPAVCRHLTRFEKLGLIIHEGVFYRRNPIYDIDRPGYTLSIKDGKLLVFRESKPLAAMKKGLDVDYWDSHMSSKFVRGDLGDAKVLAKSLSGVMTMVAHFYRFTLLSITEAPNLLAAREIANLEFDSRVRSLMIQFARSFWEQRAKARQALLELNWVGITFKSRPKREKEMTWKKKIMTDIKFAKKEERKPLFVADLNF